MRRALLVTAALTATLLAVSAGANPETAETTPAPAPAVAPTPGQTPDQAADQAPATVSESAAPVVDDVPVTAVPTNGVEVPETVEPDTGARIPAPVPTPAPPSGLPRPRAAKPPADLLKNLPADASATEIEAALAQGRQLYLVVDAARSLVEIKARGIALDAIPVEATHLLYRKTLFGRHEVPQLSVPTVWRVTAAPSEAVREIIAPAELKKWVPEEKRTDEEATAAPPSAGKGHPDEPIPPSSYRIRLDRGWELAVLERLPPRSLWSRVLDSARNGWRSLLGGAPSHPPTVALTVDKADAMRLHHLFRVDLPILLTAAAGPSPAPKSAAKAGGL